MSVFAISDLHLSFGTDKPMDVFGHTWENYEEKIKENWENLISDNDIVILNGDNSWATYLPDTVSDFEFIHKLPGRKILLKGNHDYWWSTINKHRNFCREKGFDTIDFLQNESVLYDNTAICGTRGWQLTSKDEQDQKVYDRELGRLKLSLEAGVKHNPDMIIAAMHYPPDDNFKKLLEEYGVSVCVYGHLHSIAHRGVTDTVENGITYRLVSCDYLGFVPVCIKP